jgi:phage N-6-adenine-methyltransferase
MSLKSFSKNVADVNRLAYIGRKPGAENARDPDSWYTPKTYVEAARRVMGGIDLDPFTSSQANEIIRATYYFTQEKSAFAYPWRTPALCKLYPHGFRVWMNPPYSAQLISRAIETLLEARAAGHVAQATVLVNNSTDTQWFKALREEAEAVCLTTHRIAFESLDGKRVSGNTRGQVFFYFGPAAQAEAFTVEFSRFGWCVSRERGWR